mgnify:CR=1 FL=1
MTTPVDPRIFRRALGQFPTGVGVMTTLDAEGRAVGFTASSFNSVSLDPPLVLWSIDKTAWSAPAFETHGSFVVNVLAEDQMELSNRFARRGEDKFADLAWSAGVGGCPVLEATAARFECRTWAVYDGGDHLILVGEVVHHAHDEEKAPLVFARGAYAVARRHPATA